MIPNKKKNSNNNQGGIPIELLVAAKNVAIMLIQFYFLIYLTLIKEGLEIITSSFVVASVKSTRYKLLRE